MTREFSLDRLTGAAPPLLDCLLVALFPAIMQCSNVLIESAQLEICSPDNKHQKTIMQHNNSRCREQPATYMRTVSNGVDCDIVQQSKYMELYTQVKRPFYVNEVKHILPRLPTFTSVFYIYTPHTLTWLFILSAKLGAFTLSQSER